VVEVGLNEHDRLPGEWYGVSKMNQIFRTLNETYNFSSQLKSNKLGKFKILDFQSGEIIVSRILEEAMGPY
jgi:hypothetical protein